MTVPEEKAHIAEGLRCRDSTQWPFAYFTTEPSRSGDGSPEWPKGADRRIVGIRCPFCGHSRRAPEFRNGGTPGRRVKCKKCDWTGRIPF